MKLPEWLEKRIVWRKQSKDNCNQAKIIKEITYEPSDCDSCGICLEKPRYQLIRLNSKPYKHWRQQCMTCRMYYNEQTQKFDATSAEITNYMEEKKKN